ncbi:MAG: TraR/DksA C4-type zinc finger protein [Roseibacillus sp.]
MATKKKVAKKAAKKATKKSATKAATKKSATKAAKKKSATKAAKKVSAKKTAKKAAAKKAPAKKAKKAAKKEAPSKKVAKKAAAVKAVPPAPPKKKAAPRKPVKLTIFVKKQRQRLLDLKDELMDAMYGVQQETLRNGPSGGEASGSGMHQGDAGSDAYDRDFALNLLSKEQDALQEIQSALERIAEGMYGICGISGKKIPQARLEAIPFARLTVECQSKWEQENPNRKFRSVDGLGFGGAATEAAVSLDPASE